MQVECAHCAVFYANISGDRNNPQREGLKICHEKRRNNPQTAKYQIKDTKTHFKEDTQCTAYGLAVSVDKFSMQNFSTSTNY